MPHGDRYFEVKSHSKSYVEQQLMRGERIVYTTTIHPIVFLAPIILAILTFILAFLGVAQDNPEARIPLWYFAGVAALMAIIAITSALIRYYTAEFAVTNTPFCQGRFYQTGILRTLAVQD